MENFTAVVCLCFAEPRAESSPAKEKAGKQANNEKQGGTYAEPARGCTRYVPPLAGLARCTAGRTIGNSNIFQLLYTATQHLAAQPTPQTMTTLSKQTFPFLFCFFFLKCVPKPTQHRDGH